MELQRSSTRSNQCPRQHHNVIEKKNVLADFTTISELQVEYTTGGLSACTSSGGTTPMVMSIHDNCGNCHQTAHASDVHGDTIHHVDECDKSEALHSSNTMSMKADVVNIISNDCVTECDQPVYRHEITVARQCRSHTDVGRAETNKVDLKANSGCITHTLTTQEQSESNEFDSPYTHLFATHFSSDGLYPMNDAKCLISEENVINILPALKRYNHNATLQKHLKRRCVHVSVQSNHANVPIPSPDKCSADPLISSQVACPFQNTIEVVSVRHGIDGFIKDKGELHRTKSMMKKHVGMKSLLSCATPLHGEPPSVRVVTMDDAVSLPVSSLETSTMDNVQSSSVCGAHSCYLQSHLSSAVSCMSTMIDNGPLISDQLRMVSISVGGQKAYRCTTSTNTLLCEDKHGVNAPFVINSCLVTSDLWPLPSCPAVPAVVVEPDSVNALIDWSHAYPDAVRCLGGHQIVQDAWLAYKGSSFEFAFHVTDMWNKIDSNVHQVRSRKSAETRLQDNHVLDMQFKRDKLL
jgi:hypothetical protein